MLNIINVICSRKRWTKRIMYKFLNDTANVFLKKYDLQIFYNPKDMTGPSFHLAFDLDKGFKNYEEKEKLEIINRLPANGVFVDIGANIGMFSLFISKKRPDITCYAFEPEPLNFTNLSQSKKANNLTNLNIFQLAIGKEECTLNLYKSNKNDGGHSLTRDNEHTHSSLQSSTPVQVMPLTKTLPQSLSSLDVIKVDVEGGEIEVIEGALDTIKKYRPMLVMETSNQHIANQTGIFAIFQKEFSNQIFSRIPGNPTKIPLSQLPEIAKEKLHEGAEDSNYIFDFEK